MCSRSLFASSLMASLLAVCILGIAPVANDASAGKLKRDSIPLPMGPSYIYYDYPYYYSRGHYPTHIGGYVYYPRNYYTRGLSRGPGSSQRPRARGHW